MGLESEAVVGERRLDGHIACAQGDAFEDSELFLNTCARCGETRLLVIDGGADFVCEEAGEVCSASIGDAPTAGGTLVAEDDEGDAEDLPLRSRLLQEVLSQDLTALEAADLFLRHGQDPPLELELKEEEEIVQQHARERKARERAASENEAWRARQKKQQRYLDGQLVDVQKGSKYLVAPKESAEERAKTSV